MIKGLLGKKANMSSVYDSHGRVTPVTRIIIEPNTVVQIKEKEKDGYRAVQVGVGNLRRTNKPLRGKLERIKVKTVPIFLREFDFDGDLSVGQMISADQVFHKGGVVDVIGKSKGRGFAGVVKRYNFAGGPKTHGQSDRHRAPGSIGATTTPGRVFKGMRMAGHMGNSQVSVFGLEIMEVNKVDNSLLIKGSVPGPSGSLLLITKSKKKRAAYHEPEIPALPNLGGAKEEDLVEKIEEVGAETVEKPTSEIKSE